jgi:hypothetical protein
VLLGAERDLAYFDEITAPRRHVIGHLHGDYERESADTIAELVQPVLDTHQRDEQQQACTSAREAIGSRAVAGIVDTWSAAREGRGHRLLVEDEFMYPARIVVDALQPAADDDSGTFDAVENTVEEVVRHGGDVLMVPADSLADVGRIALVTRY